MYPIHKVHQYVFIKIVNLREAVSSTLLLANYYATKLSLSILLYLYGPNKKQTYSANSPTNLAD